MRGSADDREQESGCTRDDDVMRRQPPASKARHPRPLFERR